MRTCLLAVVLLIAADAVRADVPALPRRETHPLVIEADPRMPEAKLQIPRKMLGKVKAALDAADGDTGYAEAPRSHTVLAGLSLALAVTFTGTWLVRRGSMNGRTLAAVGGLVLFLGVGASLWADRAPARPAPRTNQVIIEIVEEGDSVKLTINNSELTKALEHKKK